MEKAAQTNKIAGLEEFKSRHKAQLRRFQIVDREMIEMLFEALPLQPYGVELYKTNAVELRLGNKWIYQAVRILKSEGRIQILKKNIHQKFNQSK